MLAAELVESAHDAERVQRAAIDGDAVAAQEIERDVFGFVGRVLGGDAELEHVFVRGREGVQPRVFEDAGFEGDVQEVAVHRIGLLGGGLDGDAFLGAVSDHLGAAGEFVAEQAVAPRGDDLQLGRERANPA